jgi:hypothetical protein
MHPSSGPRVFVGKTLEAAHVGSSERTDDEPRSSIDRRGFFKSGLAQPPKNETMTAVSAVFLHPPIMMFRSVSLRTTPS